MSSALPRYFGPIPRPLFGWFYPGSEDRCGVVICNPFGYEAVCAHRTLRHLAERFAAAGHPTLRFDYDGCGDSAGQDTDADRLAAWLSSIDSAIDALVRFSDVQRACLVGVRIGATLAAHVAQRRADVAALIAIAPVSEGRRFVREQRMLANTQEAAQTAAAPPLLEAAGYPLSPETAAELERFSLLEASAPAAHVLQLERDDMPASQAWTQKLIASKVAVDRQMFSGYSRMLADPHDTAVPEEMITACARWLQQLPLQTKPIARPLAAHDARPEFSGPQRMAALTAAATGLKRDICEEASTAGGIFSITTRPAQESRRPGRHRRQLLLLINSGAIHHTGPSRLYVSLARELAARGMTVLRMDIRGVGDSPPRAGAPENVVYSPEATADISELLSTAAQSDSPPELHLAGICSGAFHSLKSTLGPNILRSAVVINPLAFQRSPDMSLDIPEHMATAEARRYQRSALRLASWQKLLSGRVNVLKLADILRRRVQSFMLYRLKRVGRDLRLPVGDDLPGELRAIAARRTRLLFIFSQSDVGLSMLLEQGGTVVGQLSRRGALEVEIVAGADHTFTRLPWRAQLLSLMTQHFARYLRHAAQ